MSIKMPFEKMKIGDRFYIEGQGFCYLEAFMDKEYSMDTYRGKLKKYGNDGMEGQSPYDLTVLRFRLEHARAGKVRDTKDFRWEHFRVGSVHIRKAALQREPPPTIVPIEGPLKELQVIDELALEEKRKEVKLMQARDMKRRKANEIREAKRLAKRRVEQTARVRRLADAYIPTGAFFDGIMASPPQQPPPQPPPLGSHFVSFQTINELQEGLAEDEGHL